MLQYRCFTVQVILDDNIVNSFPDVNIKTFRTLSLKSEPVTHYSLFLDHAVSV